MTSRPRIAILGRFADETSATRYGATVTAQRLADVVWAAGGEPLTLLPMADSDWNQRLAHIDGVLMPGGGDINPTTYGQEPESDALYGINDLQDQTDISLIKYALLHSIPMLTICRGTQIANVALGGTLVQDMPIAHRHVVNPVTITSDVEELGLSSPTVQASCYHHQVIDKVANTVTPIAFSHDGYVEAVKYESSAFAYGVQWHPEDNFDTEKENLEIVTAFIDACR